MGLDRLSPAANCWFKTSLECAGGEGVGKPGERFSERIKENICKEFL